MNNSQVGRLGLGCGIISLILSGREFLVQLFEPPVGLLGISGLPRLQLVIFLGITAAAFHGVLWILTEKAFGWRFGEGEGESQPQGWPAIALSVTMTIPLVLLPPLYARITRTAVVLPGHSVASWFVVVVAAAGHLFLYGSKALNWQGMRNAILPTGAPPDFRKAAKMELAYALTHFGSIVSVYRVALNSQLGPMKVPVVVPVAISTLVWFSAVCISIFLKYPESLADKGWAEVRGVVHALMLTIALEGGMLM